MLLQHGKWFEFEFQIKFHNFFYLAFITNVKISNLLWKRKMFKKVAKATFNYYGLKS